MTQIINLEIFDKAKKLMEEKFPLMLQYFCEDAEKYINEIEKGLSDKNIDSIIYSAHTIKSCSAQIGAMKLSGTAKKLELMCRTTEKDKIDYTQIEKLYNLIKSEFNEANLKFDEIVEGQKPA